MAGDDDIPTPKIDSSSPYYLGSHDVPSAKISNIMLTRYNYQDWQKSMRMSLKSRRKFGFVDGTLKKPTDPVTLDNWEVVHCTLVQWIRNMIDPALLPTIPYGEDAAALWANLKARFSVVDATLIHSLKTQLKNCVQTKGMDVTTYFGKLQTLWDALIVHEPPFACKCGDCKCDLGTDAINRLDNERLHQFFMGLDSSLYGNIRSQQFQFDPLPTLSRAYHVVLQEERLRAETTPADTSDVAAFALSSSRPDWRAQREKERSDRHQKLICPYCETRGHDVANCFFKTNRFPEWWGDSHALGRLSSLSVIGWERFRGGNNTCAPVRVRG
ncbi:uncharacterized protein LOC141631670 [Silene latifolia]|uniref:uncharacterized protein LOC141631670 n=1 Tax=Silene latifolia TaxID=37657 RepID=UPI003D77E36E